VGFGETEHFSGGADDQAWSVGELHEVLKVIGVGRWLEISISSNFDLKMQAV
jgi:hypothetical protein